MLVSRWVDLLGDFSDLWPEGLIILCWDDDIWFAIICGLLDCTNTMPFYKNISKLAREMCLMYGTQMSSCVMSDSIPKTMRVVVNLYKEVQLAMHAYAQVKMGCLLPPCTLDNCNFLCDEPLWIAVKSLRLGLRRWRGKMRIWAPRISDHYLWLFHSLWAKFLVSFHPKLSTNASRKPRCDSVQAVAKSPSCPSGWSTRGGSERWRLGRQSVYVSWSCLS